MANNGYKKPTFLAQILLVITHAARKRWEWIMYGNRTKCLGDDGYCSLGESMEE